MTSEETDQAAAHGESRTGAERAAAPPPTSRRRHFGSGWNLLLSTGLVFAVVLAWLALAPRPSRIERPEVDVAAKARQVNRETGLPLASLAQSKEWRATSVSWTAPPGTPATWQVGYHRRPDDQAYLQLSQTVTGASAADTEQWVTAQVRQGSPAGIVQVGGTPWQLYVSGGEPIRRSLVLRKPVGQLTTVLTGNLPVGELTARAASLVSLPATVKVAG